MQIYDAIAKAQDGQAISNLARQLGITEDQARAAIETAMPALIAGIERNTLSRGGLSELVRALGDGHHEQILERPDIYRDPRVQQDGMGILGHILGSESRARGLAVQTARATGLSDSIIQMLLPILAQMLMGALSKWLKGGLGDIMNRIPGGSPGGVDEPAPRRSGREESDYGRGFELPKAELPQGGYPMPPMPGGGDDGFRRGGTMEQSPTPLPRTTTQSPPGGFPMPWPSGGTSGQGEVQLPGGWPQQGGGGQLPLPLPGGQAGNPYGDLADILRRGGSGVGRPSGGGLGGAVRDMIGGALGFKNSGVMSWLVRLLVMRYGWGLLKRLLGRALTGR